MAVRLLVITGFSLLLINCSDMKFKSIQKSEAMKEGIIGDETNIGTRPPNPTSPISPISPTNPLNPGSPFNPGISIPNDDKDDVVLNPNYVIPPEDVEYTGNVSVPVSYLCSDSKSSGGNLATATSLSLLIVDSAGNILCQENNSTDIRNAINQRDLNFKNCKLPAGKHNVLLLDQNGRNLAYDSGTVEVNGNGLQTESTDVLVDSNPDRDDSDNTPAYAGSKCDRKASPLYVDLREEGDPKGVLSAPEDGVMFDILGANGDPAYSKNQISWFKRGRFGLLTLPNSNGEVLGIDQLFGDNTRGPDGQFAANGFLALAKYDLNGDNRIDIADPVYSQLRLWIDKNSDGVSRPKELRTLESLRIESIDLVYDPNYSEKDKHGNEIKYKSVVNFKNGKMRSIFDIWFILK